MATPFPFLSSQRISPDIVQPGREAGRKSRHILRTMAQWLGILHNDFASGYLPRIDLHLKKCPLCDCINVVEAEHCACCAWHGAFDHDPKRLEAAFMVLLAQCPDLLDILPPKRRKAPWWVSVRLKWRRYWYCRKRLDLRA